jgi:hypothetical protein
MPQERGDYAMGGDVAEGRLSDVRNEASEPDRSAALVIERQTLEDAAEYVGRVEADAFGEQMGLAGRFYNLAYLTPEINAVGQATLLALRRMRYPRIMLRPAPPDSRDQDPRNFEGWRTMANNRDALLDLMLSYLRPNAWGTYEGQSVIRSSAFLDELATFIRTATGRREHMSGKHDDLIFARALAYMVHVTCPRGWRPRTVGLPPERQTLRDLAMVGAVDYGPSGWRPGGRVGGAEIAR